MKYRNDFVTNSSSSSFIVTINIETKDGNVEFCGHGGSPESGRIDFFDFDAIITASPKKMCEADSIEELIQILTNGVCDGNEWDEGDPVKIFEESNPVEVFDFDDENFFDDPESTMKTVDAYEFIKLIRKNIKDIKDILSITVEGIEENYMTYAQTYKYDNRTKEYTGHIVGYEFEKDGASGGYVNMPDIDECDVTEEECD